MKTYTLQNEDGLFVAKNGSGASLETGPAWTPDASDAYEFEGRRVAEYNRGYIAHCFNIATEVREVPE